MTTKKCSTCKVVKPVSEYYKYNRDGKQTYQAACIECEKTRGKLSRKNREASYQQNGLYNRITLHDCRRALVVSMMHVAYQDGCGKLGTNETRHIKQEDIAEIIQDGSAFFEDGRYAFWADLIGIDPHMRPQWVKGKPEPR